MAGSDNHLMDTTELARQARILALQSIKEAKSGHPGGSLSVCDILAVLYNEVMRPRPYHPADKNRDICILSKGHAAPILYALWDILGYTDNIALGLRKIGQPAQGHPALIHTSYCETSTGSLGQGFAVAVGYALALKSTGRKVYVVVGDGELHEGIIAESARIARQYGLHNLTCIVDYNGLQSDDFSQMMVNPLAEFAAWGWQVRLADGHNLDALRFALNSDSNNAPKCIVAQTIKGKGVAYMENEAKWHGSVTLTIAQLNEALAGLQ